MIRLSRMSFSSVVNQKRWSLDVAVKLSTSWPRRRSIPYKALLPFPPPTSVLLLAWVSCPGGILEHEPREKRQQLNGTSSSEVKRELTEKLFDVAANRQVNEILPVFSSCVIVAHQYQRHNTKRYTVVPLSMPFFVGYLSFAFLTQSMNKGESDWRE